MKPLDPKIAGILSRLGGEPAPLPGHTPEEVRALFSARILAETVGATQPEVSIAAVAVPTRAGSVAARLYRPSACVRGCGILFFHSGGFVIGDLETGEPVALALCRHTGWPALSIEYRLAPEHPFPAAVEDAVDAGTWIAGNLDTFGEATNRFVVAGDSAGGTLAAAVAQEIGRATPALVAQCLLYPGLDLATVGPQTGEDPFIDADTIAWFQAHYPGSTDPRDPRVSPGLAENLGGLPPAVFGVSGRDPLTPGAQRYQARLQRAGVSTWYHTYEELPHGFAEFDGLSAVAEAAMREIGADLVTAARIDPRADDQAPDVVRVAS